MRSFTTRYGIVLALIAGAICFGGISLAQQAQPSPAPAPAVPQQLEAHPVAIGGPVGSPTYVLPPAAPAPKGGFINIGQAFSPMLEPYIDALMNALIAAAVGWVALLYTKVTGKAVEQHDRDAVTKALQNEAGSLIADGKVQLIKTVDGIKIHVDSDTLANTANHGLSKIPDAQKAFGITPDAFAKRIIDTIPQIAAGAEMLVKASDKVTPAALPAPKGA